MKASDDMLIWVFVFSKAAVKMTASPYVYTGSAINPVCADMTVKLGGSTLAGGIDYEIEKVYNNVNPGKAVLVLKSTGKGTAGVTGTKTVTFTIKKGRELTQAGTAKVTLHGINGYGGKRTVSFKIVKKKAGYLGALKNGKWVR